MDTLREHLTRIAQIRSEAKRRASRENGALGGRPKGSKNKPRTKPNMQGIAHIGRTMRQKPATS